MILVDGWCHNPHRFTMVLPNIRAIVDVTEVTQSVCNGCLQNSDDQVGQNYMNWYFLWVCEVDDSL